jgi:hypothetical protein
MIFNKNGLGTAEIAKYATWTSNHDYNHIAQALILAKRKMLNIIDKKTYATALAHYLSNNYEKATPVPADIINDQLVHSMQVVLVNWAYSKNIYKDSVIYDNSGINIVWSDNFRPAMQNTIDSLIDSFEKHGYEFLDLLIEFLNDNRTTFTDFQASVEGLRIRQLFVNDAEDFSYYFNINNSTALFFELLDRIRRAQRNEILAALGTSYYAKVTDYQLKRLEIESAITAVNTFANLPLAPAVNSVCLVLDENAYYKFTTVWEIYVENVSQILELVKPTLVELTMHSKILSDLSNVTAKDPKQIELLRANADFLRQSANGGLGKIIEYLKSLIPGNTVVDDSLAAPEPTFSHSSFML